MSSVDCGVLLFFDEHPIRVLPKVIAANIDYGRQYVGKRRSTLAVAELFEFHGTGLCQLTDTGHAYLEGELDVNVLKIDE